MAENYFVAVKLKNLPREAVSSTDTYLVWVMLREVLSLSIYIYEVVGYAFQIHRLYNSQVFLMDLLERIVCTQSQLQAFLIFR